MAKRLAVIGLGYLAAIALGLVAAMLNALAAPYQVSDGSSGMAAFGDFMLFLAVAGVAALVPTASLLRLILRR